MAKNNDSMLAGGLAGILHYDEKALVSVLDHAFTNQYQAILRVPFLDAAVINAVDKINKENKRISLAARAGSLTKKDILSVDDYDKILNDIKERKIEKEAFNDACVGMVRRHNDLDLLFILKSDKPLAEEEERNYRFEVKEEIEKVILPRQEAFQNTFPVKFGYDVHKDSMITEDYVKREMMDAEERASKSEEYKSCLIGINKTLEKFKQDSNPTDYDFYRECFEKSLGKVRAIKKYDYFKSLDKIALPFFDEIEIKPKIPVVICKSDFIDPTLDKIVESKINDGLLQTREKWYNEAWKNADEEYGKRLSEQRKVEISRLMEEYNSEVYGRIPKETLGTTVLQRLSSV